ncbi:AAA domain-containing protein [Dunaliella salina]|uniref:AAA domain-containing protein n=1 Tax=Dunaliella salina TaxID=3046 RepID=A0ABQ7GM66_DUNSA|nr:AAA domain-containing protein [Dunaliella salina]|eukprot:KAF5835698.1 AAA domain-containing protein [Dunaliella salina]
MERDRMRMVILDEANIVCSTLSFAGSSAFSRLSRKFDVVVIDEAAQAVEPATLVPIINGCKQLYLVGDPVQLPATVISTRAQDHKYDMSLFKRLQNGGYPVKMLNTQYRMHPDISFFPSQQFYGGGLLDGQGTEEHTKQPWHSQPCFGPLAFYDVAGKESVPLNGASIENKAEANMVLCVYREMVHRNPSLRKNASVAVISPYKAQVKLLREAFKTALGEEMARLVDVNTIDGFQGREKDVCFFSCVRALRKGRKGGGIGFVADERRINVGLTRARCSLIVIGNARALQYNQNWASLIHHTMTNGRFFRPKAPYADWMTLAASGGCPPVTPTEQELDTLNKARTKLSAEEQAPPPISLEPHRKEDAMEEGLAEELHESELADEDEGDVGVLDRAAGEKKAPGKDRNQQGQQQQQQQQQEQREPEEARGAPEAPVKEGSGPTVANGGTDEKVEGQTSSDGGRLKRQRR